MKHSLVLAGAAMIAGTAASAWASVPPAASNGRTDVVVPQSLDQQNWAMLRAHLDSSLRTPEGQAQLSERIREKVSFLSESAQQRAIQATMGALGQLAVELEVTGEGFLAPRETGECAADMPDPDSRAFVTTRVWPDGDIYYRFSDDIVDLFEDPPEPPIDANDANALESIPNTLAAMLAIETATELRFLGYDATVHGPAFVMIESNGPDGGCFNRATVGFTGGENFFSVCAWQSLGVIVHELGHTIGFFHEHQRPDRNSFVEIKEENIVPAEGFPFAGGGASEFVILNFTGALAGPYDLMSVMHYSDEAFSILDGLKTICVLPPNEHLQDQIGNGSFFSDGDIAAITTLYGDDNIWTWDPTALCPTDVDNNRIIEVADILAFMDLLRAQNIFADLNSDGRWDLLDFNIFMNRWQPGFCDPEDPINPTGRPTGVLPG